MDEFNPDLHAFLLENEMCMWVEKDELKFGVHVHFCDIKEFIDILGHHVLDDGGIDCNLNNEYTLFIPIDDYFLNNNLMVNHYKHCFSESDLRDYAAEIEKFDNYRRVNI